MRIECLLTGLGFVGNIADGVGKSLKNHNSSKPAVNQVHGVERDTSELDDGVVAAGQDEKRNHVDDSHDTRTAKKLASTCREAAVVDLPDTETDVDSEVSNEEEALKAAGQGSNVEGSRHLELAVVTSVPKGCIKARLLEAGKQAVGDSEVSLGVVVEA